MLSKLYLHQTVVQNKTKNKISEFYQDKSVTWRFGDEAEDSLADRFTGPVVTGERSKDSRVSGKVLRQQGGHFRVFGDGARRPALSEPRAHLPHLVEQAAQDRAARVSIQTAGPS